MSYNVLVVDDDRFMVSLVKQYMNMADCSVTEAYEGKQALSILSELGAQVDLIITDLHMPIMDGIEFAKALRALKQYINTPIILMTNDVEVSSKFATDPQFSVFNALLFKPFTLPEVISTLDKLLPQQGKQLAG